MEKNTEKRPVQSKKTNNPFKAVSDKRRAVRAEKNRLIGGYTKEQYANALDELDDNPEDDFFGTNSYTESQSTVMAIIKALVYIIMIVVVSAALSIFAITCANDVFALVKEDTSIEVVIPEYATTDDLADILGEAGVINYPWLFRLYADLKGIDSNDYYDFVAGTYTVTPSMNYDKLMMAFIKTVRLETVRITFPEGATVDEVIELFESNGCSNRDAFLETMKTYDFGAKYEFLADIDMTDRYYPVEGYLYPDTYEFYVGREPDYYLCRMIDQFETVCTRAGFFEAAEDMGVSIDYVISIASIVEKEAYMYNDVDIVSSVIWNRLNNSTTYPRLECDSTIVYFLSCEAGERVTTLTNADLQIDNPYNSYLKDGLPPGAICNPGSNAIACAFAPAETEKKYYFFASNKKGEMYYATTDLEHEANLRQIAKDNAASGE